MLQVDLPSSYKTVPFCEVAADMCDRTLPSCSMFTIRAYPLVMTNIAVENHPAINGKIHEHPLFL